MTVVRDARWGEPTIFGATDADMAFGAGYVAAEDRLPIMELLRALGRGEAFELLGTVPAWLADAEIARLYGYTEEEFQAMIDRLPEVYGQTGADIKRILDAHVEGINAYITPTGPDRRAVEADRRRRRGLDRARAVRRRRRVGARNAAVLARADARLRPRARARASTRTSATATTSDGPVHTTKRFPYMQRDASKLDPRANALGFTAGSDGITGSIEQLLPQLRRARRGRARSSGSG